jgi:hypothetical protein
MQPAEIPMPTDAVGTPEPRGSGLKQALGGFGVWLGGVARGINVTAVARFWKYVVLISCVILTLIVVFDAYSFYVARRDIDSELRSKKEKVSSLEYLGVLAQRKRGLAITSLEGRCMERTQLTLFRILDAEHDKIKAVYNDMMKIKNQMVETITQQTSRGLIDVDKAEKFFNLQGFTLAEFDRYIEPINPEIANNVDYKHLKDQLEKLRIQYVAVATANAPLRAEVEKLIQGSPFTTSTYWSMDEIQKVAQRNVQVRKELEETKAKYGDIEDVMARYGVWTGALTGGAANSPLLDEMAVQFEQAEISSLDKPNCAAFKDYYAAVNDRILERDPLQGMHWQDLNWGQRIHSIPRYYGQYLQTYFNQPPAAQTLFVTMVLGALGALTLNVLRMSKVGWWSLQDDPPWGEIIVGPLLGALAAFGIFLIGSSGLLLTSDNSGSQPLSAYFIGLLGFLSGLLYDEAFGRVRRVGTQLFAAKPGEDVANARAEDRSLAQALQSNSASLAAGFVIKYGIGTRISLESEFTLLIPSDDAMGRISLATWNALNDPKGDLFEKWYHRHHAAKRLTKADVAGGGTTPAVGELQVDDGKSYPLALDGGGFKINGVRVLIADVTWNKGVIHILSEELP